MAVETKLTVVLHDGRRVELPSKEQLWQVELRISPLNEHGTAGTTCVATGVTHVSRETLEQHGLLPRVVTKRLAPGGPTPTAEDLILELLECVGVYPTEG